MRWYSASNGPADSVGQATHGTVEDGAGERRRHLDRPLAAAPEHPLRENDDVIAHAERDAGVSEAAVDAAADDGKSQGLLRETDVIAALFRGNENARTKPTPCGGRVPSDVA